MHSAAESQPSVAEPNGSVGPTWAGAAIPRVQRYLRCLRCPRDLTQDLAQETMLQAVRSWPAQEPPLPWLLVTARNLWFAYCRRSRAVVSMEQLQELHDRALRELGSDGGDGRVAALRACVEALPERSQRALQFYYEEGLTRGEVAERLGLSDEGVKSLLERVKLALKQCVQRRQDDA